MSHICHINARLPRTGGSIQIEIPYKPNSKGVQELYQEVTTMYNRYPLQRVMVSLNKDNVTCEGQIIEAPKSSKKDQASLLINSQGLTHRLIDWVESFT